MIELELHPPLELGQTFCIEREYIPADVKLGGHYEIDCRHQGQVQHSIGEVTELRADMVKIEIVRVYGGGK